MIKITSVLDPKANPVHGDSARLQQVVWNVLANAIKFTPDGGRVSITLKRVHSHVEIIVSDTGTGIAPEVLAHVFDKFHQADTSMGRRHGGLGLGLAIAKNLVELHGGLITAQSPGIGQGATFCVQLPLPASHLEDGTDQPTYHGGQSSEAMDLRGIKVLAVDDEPDALEALRRLLENRRAQVTVCHSGEAVLGLLQKLSFNVLVSDIGMPGMDGLTLIRNVRSLGKPMSQIPAIALTAFARSEDRRRAITAGFDTYLAKPVDPTELMAIIARLSTRSGGVAAAVLA
jgi:CheY-like chemotaxis protein